MQLQSGAVIVSATSKSISSQSRCFLEPKTFLRGLSPVKLPLRGSEHPPDHPAPFTLTMLAFLLMFISGIMSVFYLILFLAGFSDTHPGHNKTAGNYLLSQEKLYIIWYPSIDKTITRVQQFMKSS